MSSNPTVEQAVQGEPPLTSNHVDSETGHNMEEKHLPDHSIPVSEASKRSRAPSPSSGEADVEKVIGTTDKDDVNAADHKQSQESPRDVHGIKWGLAVFSVLVSTFLFALDNTIVADIQPAIVRDFGSVSKLSWLSVAFLVAAIGTNLFWYVFLLLIFSC